MKHFFIMFLCAVVGLVVGLLPARSRESLQAEPFRPARAGSVTRRISRFSSIAASRNSPAARSRGETFASSSGFKAARACWVRPAARWAWASHRYPIGASGTRILATLIYALQDRGLKRGLASLCLGGGEAVAMAIELE